MSVRCPQLGRSLPAAILVAVLAGGCQTTVTTNDGRPLPPQPRPLPAVPAGAGLTDMAMQVGLRPADSNGNGYPDLIPVEVYLFAKPHPAAVHRPGTFEFTLYLPGQIFDDEEVTALAHWTIGPAGEEAARFRSPMFGDGYSFRLNLLEVADDELPLMSATLVCRFEPNGGGAPVRSTGDHAIRIGRRDR